MNVTVSEEKDNLVTPDDMVSGEIGQVVGYGAHWFAYSGHYMLKSGNVLVDLSSPASSWAYSVGSFPAFKLRLLPKGAVVTLTL